MLPAYKEENLLTTSLVKHCWGPGEVRELAFFGKGGEAGTPPFVRDFAGLAWLGVQGHVYDPGGSLFSHHHPSDTCSLC